MTPGAAAFTAHTCLVVSATTTGPENAPSLVQSRSDVVRKRRRTTRQKTPKGFSPTHELHHDRYHCYGATVFASASPGSTNTLERERDSLTNPAKRLEDRISPFDQGYELATGGSSSQDALRDMAYRSGMRESGAVEEEKKRKKERKTTTATRTPLP